MDEHSPCYTCCRSSETLRTPCRWAPHKAQEQTVEGWQMPVGKHCVTMQYVALLARNDASVCVQGSSQFKERRRAQAEADANRGLTLSPAINRRSVKLVKEMTRQQVSLSPCSLDSTDSHPRVIIAHAMPQKLNRQDFRMAPLRTVAPLANSHRQKAVQQPRCTRPVRATVCTCMRTSVVVTRLQHTL
jgi:hypothetical protein